MTEPYCKNDIKRSFKVFLEKAVKDGKKLENFHKVLVVLGNVSCDLDSAACALAYAFLLHVEACGKKAPDTETIIPMLNITTGELHLKTEVCFILKQLDIPLELIMTRSDVDLRELADRKKLALTMVDHHELARLDEGLEESVVRVIDHRPLDHEWKLPSAVVTVEQVGSCASLVADEILKRRPDSLSTFPPQVFRLLYGAILLDTMNFSTESKRFTDLDVRMTDRIESAIEPTVNLTRDGIYESLLRARGDISDLTTLDCLLKDFKVADGGVHVCTLTTLVREFLKRSDAESTLISFQHKSQSQGIVLIGISMGDGYLRRDIGLFSSTSSVFASKLISALQQSRELNLGLEIMPDSSIEGLTLCTQKNVEKTRKHIFPILQKEFIQWRCDNK